MTKVKNDKKKRGMCVFILNTVVYRLKYNIHTHSIRNWRRMMNYNLEYFIIFLFIKYYRMILPGICTFFYSFLQQITKNCHKNFVENFFEKSQLQFICAMDFIDKKITAPKYLCIPNLESS